MLQIEFGNINTGEHVFVGPFPWVQCTHEDVIVNADGLCLATIVESVWWYQDIPYTDMVISSYDGAHHVS